MCTVDTHAPVGARDGVLGGEPVVIKDAIDVLGVRTGLGLRDGGDQPTEDAVVVARIRAAGGWIAGKTKMTELGMDGVGALMPHPMPRNPRAPGYFPGGSSTGTAVAVASGLARYGIGSDGLGSVRIPAAYCGLVGLKPGSGRLPAAGYRSPVVTLDVPGPIARTVDDCARFWRVMMDEPQAVLSAPHVPARVGIIRQLSPARASRAIRAAFARVLETLGIAEQAVDIPGADRCTFLGGLIGATELADSPYAARDLSPAGRMNVALGRAFSERDRAGLAAQRASLCDATARALDQSPILAMPTTAVPPPALSRALLAGDQDLMLLRALGAYTPLANLTGLPAHRRALRRRRSRPPRSRSCSWPPPARRTCCCASRWPSSNRRWARSPSPFPDVPGPGAGDRTHARTPVDGAASADRRAREGGAGARGQRMRV